MALGCVPSTRYKRQLCLPVQVKSITSSMRSSGFFSSGSYSQAKDALPSYLRKLGTGSALPSLQRHTI